MGAIPEDDVERLAAIRTAVGPKIMLRADANQGYTPKEAIRLCRMCERRDLGLELLEQPVPKWDLAGMAQVRAAVDVLIEADEAAYTPHDVVQIIRAQAADVINIKIAKAGGLYQSKKIAAVAEAAGLECVIGTAWGLGVKVAAKLHLAAPTRSLRDGVEFTELMLHDLLLAGPQAADLAPPLSDGYLNVPLGPGLGVTLNPEKLRPTSCRNITHNSSRTSACVSVLRMRSSVPNTHCVAPLSEPAHVVPTRDTHSVTLARHGPLTLKSFPDHPWHHACTLCSAGATLSPAVRRNELRWARYFQPRRRTSLQTPPLHDLAQSILPGKFPPPRVARSLRTSPPDLTSPTPRPPITP